MRGVEGELAALARTQFVTLGGEAAGTQPALPLLTDAGAAAMPSAEQQWRRRVQALPPRLRTLGGVCGLGGSAGEVAFSRSPPPLAFALSDLLILTKLPPLLPIAGVDEPIDFAARTQALVKRMYTGVLADALHRPATEGAYPADRHGVLQPLATPTHAHGWIAPRLLVERLAGYDDLSASCVSVRGARHSAGRDSADFSGAPKSKCKNDAA